MMLKPLADNVTIPRIVQWQGIMSLTAWLASVNRVDISHARTGAYLNTNQVGIQLQVAD